MFDVEKVCRMTDELETFARAHEELYLIVETVSGDMIALLHRLKINVRAIILDAPLKPGAIHESFLRNSMHEDFLKLPSLKTVDAAKNFNERTGIIVIVKKPLPIFQTELSFIVNERRLQVPTFILSPDEISAIYGRLTLRQTLKEYEADGISKDIPVKIFVEKFMQGLKTFLKPESQTLKYQTSAEDHFNFKYDFADAAIVIQGPLVYENNYTAETLKLYRRIYPNAPIVVSTWTGEATDEFRRVCKKNSVVLLENVPPDFAGPYNVNMQLESSLRGVNFVRENTAAEFVLKTRCDQRINKPDFLTFFRNLILTFPPFGDKLRGRIILLEALKCLPFRVTDFLAFGYVEDISKLYGISRHCGEFDAPIRRKKHPRLFGKVRAWLEKRQTLRNRVPSVPPKKLRQFNNVTKKAHEIESYILKKFYEENIAAIDYDKFLETGWKFMKDYLVIVGFLEVLLDWPKYEKDLQYEVRPMHTGLSGEIDFSRWLDLYRNY